MRIGQVRLRGVAAMAGLANDTAVKPRRRLHRARGAERSAATRVSPCAVRKPGQAGWRDRQDSWPAQYKTAKAASALRGNLRELDLARSTPLHNLDACFGSRPRPLLSGQNNEVRAFIETLCELTHFFKLTLPTLESMERRRDLVDYIRLNASGSRLRDYSFTVSSKTRMI